MRRPAVPTIGGVAGLGLILIGVFLVWLMTAWAIFEATLGPTLPPGGATPTDFAQALLFTAPGQAMMVSVVSFPLLLDCDTGLYTAITTSFRAVLANPRPMALWGLVLAVVLLEGRCDGAGAWLCHLAPLSQVDCQVLTGSARRTISPKLVISYGACRLEWIPL